MKIYRYFVSYRWFSLTAEGFGRCQIETAARIESLEAIVALEKDIVKMEENLEGEKYSAHTVLILNYKVLKIIQY